MGLLNDIIRALDERDERRERAHREWLLSPEGREESARWADEESRYGDR